jgi:hypothetical protein
MAGTQTVVGINSWVAHHNSSIFGPDVNAFRPERWLVEDKEQLSAMDKYYMPVSFALCYRGTASSSCCHNPTSFSSVNRPQEKVFT